MPSYSTIIQRAFGASYDTALRLAGNEYLKPLSIGQHWTRLRIGMLLTLPYGSTSNLQAGWLLAGFCNNQKSYFSNDAACVAYMFPRYNQVGDWTYNANSGNPYYSTTSYNGVVRIGTTTYASGISSSVDSRIPISDVANPRRGLFIVDITKSATSWSFGQWCDTAAQTATDYNMTDLYNACEQVAANPVVRGVTLSAGVTVTVTGSGYSETTNGYLNTMNLFWNRIAYPLEIYGLTVYEIY